MNKIVIFLISLFIATSGLIAATPLTLLEQTSEAFTQIAEKAMPATVNIKAEIVQSHGGFDPFQDDFFRRFFGNGQMNPFHQNPEPQIAGGSGFLISSDGYVVTNNHVIKDASKILVVMNDGKEYVASIKGTDPRTDLALLKIEGENFPFLTFGNSEELKIGELAIAIGNPFGIGATLTLGVISAKGRQNLGLAAYEDYIQTDAAINPGNSGGPLLNIRGEVIGINTALLSRGGGYMGISLSIPSYMAQNVIDQILDHGVVKKGYLGILFQPVDKNLAEAFGLENQEGAFISDIVKGTAASKAGFQVGDIVLQINEKPVKNITKLRNDIGMMQPGTKVNFLVMRDNEKITIEAELGTLDGEVLSGDILQKLGLEIENLTEEMSERLGFRNIPDGLVITKVKQGSPAFAAGLKPGQLVTGIATKGNQQKQVKNVIEFEEALKEVANNKYLVLIVRQQNFQRYYTLKMP